MGRPHFGGLLDGGLGVAVVMVSRSSSWSWTPWNWVQWDGVGVVLVCQLVGWC